MSSISRILPLLPERIGKAICALPEKTKSAVREIRLRENLPLSLTLPTGNILTDGYGNAVKFENAVCADTAELFDCVQRLTQYSLYAFEGSVKNGYIPLPGGARAGICGRAVPADGKIQRFSKITSVNIRIPGFFPDFALPLAKYFSDNSPVSALILSPPGCGKTSFLKSAAYLFSCRSYPRPYRVGIADERSEIELPLECRGIYDRIVGAAKATACEILLRTMNPEIIICDELSENEASFAADCANAGCAFLASAHADGRSGAKRPFIDRLINEGVFSLIVSINKVKTPNKGEKFECVITDCKIPARAGSNLFIR